MDERLKENELFQTAHIMILICYTTFATVLIGETLLPGWETWAFVLIANADRGMLFITYAGMEQDEITQIRKFVSERAEFDHIYLV